MKTALNSPDISPVKALLSRLDWDLQQLHFMVENCCHEAHFDDDEIEAVLAENDPVPLEIVSDSADELLVKGLALITEARLAIALFREGSDA